MRTTINIPAAMGARFVEAALEGLSQLATEQHAAQQLPPLYTSGVRYVRERGTEHWQTPMELLTSGTGDCEDLSAYRVGELRASGVDPDASVVIERTGPRTLHAIVRRGDGSLEDPSQALGMRGPGDGVAMPRMLAGVEREQSWAQLGRRTPGVIYAGPTLIEAVQPELGIGPAALPVLDTIARVAQGALSAVLPQQPGARVQQPTMPVARDVSAALRQEGVDVTPGEVLQLAAQLARIVQAEGRRIAQRERRR